MTKYSMMMVVEMMMIVVGMAVQMEFIKRMFRANDSIL